MRPHHLYVSLFLVLGACAPQHQQAPPAGTNLFPETARYEVAFSPRRGAQELIIKAIDSAMEELLVATYTYTSAPITNALLQARDRGVRVSVVSDDGEAGKSYSAIPTLVNQGIPVRIDGHYAIHHNKFIVIDRKHLETGSYNYTASAADRNAENVLVIWNTPELAELYATEWQRLWDESDIISTK